MSARGVLAALALVGVAGVVGAQALGENCDAGRSLHGACTSAKHACYKTGGFVQCAAAAGKGKGCQHSRECAMGLYCSEKGVCAAAMTVGEECLDSYWGCGRMGYCGEDEECVGFKKDGGSCERWLECAAGSSCLGGECAPKRKAGGECYNDEDCARGECDTEENECRLGTVGDDCLKDLGCKGDLMCGAKDVCAKREEEVEAKPATKAATTTKEKKTTEADVVFEKTADDEKEEEKEEGDGESFLKKNTAALGGGIGGGVALIVLAVCCCCCINQRRDKAFQQNFTGESSNFSTYAV